MPDLLDVVVSRVGGTPAPQFKIEGRVTDSVEQTDTLVDHTGSRALMFPAVLSTLSDAQQEELMGIIAARILLWKADL